MKIRQAEKEDLKDVLSLFKQLDKLHRKNLKNVNIKVWEKYRQDYFVNSFDDKSKVFFVAQKKGKIIGFADISAGMVDDDIFETSTKYFTIDNLVVHEKYRRQHVGKKLFLHIEKVASDFGIDHIELKVYEFNDARKFYEHMGYQTEVRKMKKELQ